LEELIALNREALSLLPDGHDKRYNVLRHLGWDFFRYYRCTQQVTDLDEAIANFRASVALTPAPHPDRAGSLRDLAMALEKRSS
ncbi:hypothetical protein PUNSTDRAFT_23014, partial [Punctularia strigosozonata HHB-11173 SS5]|uniref:uncharacterized protein n=1 Tax=Punctularia strigosozonata (strain HHB-11173) TaxID=741275 RepID=UPI000441681F